VPNVVIAGGRGLLVGSLAAVVTACGGGTAKSAFVYRVTVTAQDQVITVLGCPDGCPAVVNPGGYLGWEETRPLPRTYSLVVQGKRSSCPPLTALPGSPPPQGVEAGKSWALTVSSSGQCVLAPAAEHPSSP
jgi:hypothetical protein